MIRNLDDVRQHVLAAYALAETINLDHCVYGPATGGTRGYIDDTPPYYRLLAGHCATTNSKSVIEVGTHFGGSTLALLAGMKQGKAKDPVLVTMDITDLNRERLEREPEIRKVIGDSTRQGFVAGLASNLESPDVDLVYIDALKDPGFVLTTLFNIYAVGVRPKWLILDDIQTTEEMCKFWDILEEIEPEMSFLLSREFPHMRKPEMGYGIVCLEGSDDLLARVPEIMERLGLRTEHLNTNEASERYEAVPGLRKTANYSEEFPDNPIGTSNKAQLSTLFGLTRDIYTGEGDILDVGPFAGATTLAIAEGLAQNDRVVSKIGRITACDRFLLDKASYKHYVDETAELNGSVLPQFAEATAKYGAQINVVEMQMNVARWCGRPIELLVLGMARTPQINAHVLTECTPFMLPGRSLLVQREFTLPYRHWLTYVHAFLADHFELIDLDNHTAVFVYQKAIPTAKMMRVLDNRFDVAERARLVEEFGRSLPAAAMKFDVLAQAVSIATKHEQLDQARTILVDLETLLTEAETLQRTKWLAKLVSNLEATV